MGDECLVSLSYLTYHVWKRRNKVVFEAWCPPNDQVVNFARIVAREYGEYAKKIYCGTVSKALENMAATT